MQSFTAPELTKYAPDEKTTLSTQFPENLSRNFAGFNQFIQSLLDLPEVIQNQQFVRRREQIYPIMRSLLESIFEPSALRFDPVTNRSLDLSALGIIPDKCLSSSEDVYFILDLNSPDALGNEYTRQSLQNAIKKLMLPMVQLISGEEFIAQMNTENLTPEMYDNQDCDGLLTPNGFVEGEAPYHMLENCFESREYAKPFLIKISVDNFVKHLWPTVQETILESLLYPHEKISKTIKDIFKESLINMISLDMFHELFFNFLFNKCEQAQKISASLTMLPKEIHNLIGDYISAKLYPESSISELKRAFTNDPNFPIQYFSDNRTHKFYARINNEFGMALPAKMTPNAVSIVEGYFKGLAPRSSLPKDVKPSRRKESSLEEICIPTRVLSQPLFFQNIKEAIDEAPELVIKHKIMALLWDLSVCRNYIDNMGIEKNVIKNTLGSVDEIKAMVTSINTLVKYFDQNRDKADKEKLEALIRAVEDKNAEIILKIDEKMAGDFSYSKVTMDQVSLLQDKYYDKGDEISDLLPKLRLLVNEYFHLKLKKTKEIESCQLTLQQLDMLAFDLSQDQRLKDNNTDGKKKRNMFSAISEAISKLTQQIKTQGFFEGRGFELAFLLNRVRIENSSCLKNLNDANALDDKNSFLKLSKSKHEIYSAFKKYSEILVPLLDSLECLINHKAVAVQLKI